MTLTIFASPHADAAGRGRALGEAWQAQIHATWLGYERLFDACDVDRATVRELGLLTLQAVDRWAPSLADEMAGIAAGAALEPWQVGALNARTEILARSCPPAAGECSTSVFLPEDGQPPRTLQTWDWHEHLDHAKLVWQIQPRPGRTVKTFTEFGVLGKIGVNDAGLGVHFNVLQHVDDGHDVGVPVHVVARRILDAAASVEEAVELAGTARVSASTAITVVTYDGERGDACTLELSPSGLGRVDATADRFVLHTNHFLDARLARGEQLGESEPDTYARLEQLQARRSALRSADVEARNDALVVHREDGAPICCHPEAGAAFGARWRTLLVIALDLANGRLVLHDGGPCDGDRDAWITV